LATPEICEGIEEEYLDGTEPTEVSKPAAPSEPASALPDDEAAAATATATPPPPPAVATAPNGSLPEAPPPF